MNKRTMITVLVCLLCACMLCVAGCSLEQTVCDENKSMSYSIADMELATGESRKIPTLIAGNGKNATYTLSKEGIVEVKDGILYAVANGTVEITVRIECVEQNFTVVVRDMHHKLIIDNDDSKGTVVSLQEEYLFGTNATLTFTPSAKYIATSVTVDGMEYAISNNTVSFPVRRDHTVTVNYELQKYTLTVTNDSSATVTGVSSGTYDAGEQTLMLRVNNNANTTAPYLIPSVWLNGEPVHIDPSEDQRNYTIPFTLEEDATLLIKLSDVTTRPDTTANGTKVVDYATHMVGDYFIYTESKDILPEGTRPESENIKGAPYIYRGMHYSLGATSMDAFKLDSIGTVSGTVDGKTYTITKIDNSDYIGNRWDGIYGASCSDLVLYSWSEICGKLEITGAGGLTPANGVWKVGEYTSTVDASGNYEDTWKDVQEINGAEKMYVAWSKLRPGDALIHNRATDSSGHALLVTEVHVAKYSDGSINPYNSYVIYHDTGYGGKELSSTANVTVNGTKYTKVWSGTTVSGRMYFASSIASQEYTLYKQGYLPVTCKQLLTPDEVITPKGTDSLAGVTMTKSNMLTGTITTNAPFSHFTMTITDANGNPVQTATRFWTKDNITVNVSLLGSRYALDWNISTAKTLELFTEDNTIDLSKLTAGAKYHCNLTIYFGGDRGPVVARDFDFTA